ncbi:hypothetical protein TWF506_008253 [Arthrobotrys conoides]|uniref:Uncharacterized protein n=1 Tax=Arthrobotrys conoides TaxID=74498 RepID=A0AAN8NVJ9_9PEZI
MVLHIVWGWHNDSIISATELNTNTVKIPATAPLDRKSGGKMRYTCHSEYKEVLNYAEVCTLYNSSLCINHPVWDEVLLHEKPNYIWLHPSDEFNGWRSRESGADKWSRNYDYTFKFFIDETCDMPMSDSTGGPIQFTIDTAWKNEKNVLKVVKYLLDARMPVTGWWRGSRKMKSGSPEVDFGHDDSGLDEVDPVGQGTVDSVGPDPAGCVDPAHCTPPP